MDEEKWQKKFKSFNEVLEKQKERKEKRESEQVCRICGRRNVQFLCETDDNPICRICQNSGVIKLRDAEGLLYLVYGNFSRMFDIRFRYPNLFFLETFQQNINDINDTRNHYTDLIKNVGQSDYDFTIGIAKDIPYAFLEELFAFSLSKQYLMGKIVDWKNDIRSFSDNPVSFEWKDKYRNPKKLMEEVKEWLNNEENLKNKEIYIKAIMICYLYNAGREEQADILTERLKNEES